MKYVMLKKTAGQVSFYIPIIFPDSLVHADVAKAILGIMPTAEVSSAGMLGSYSIESDPYGASETLNVRSDRRDKRRIKMNDYGGAIEEN